MHYMPYMQSLKVYISVYEWPSADLLLRERLLLRGLQEGTNRLYRFTKININILSEKKLKPLRTFLLPHNPLFGLPRIEPKRVTNIFMISTTLRVKNVDFYAV